MNHKKEYPTQSTPPLTAANLALQAGRCDWREDSSGDYWHTCCDHLFTFTDDGPKENGFKYCCYCGRVLNPITVLDAITAEDAGEGR